MENSLNLRNDDADTRKIADVLHLLALFVSIIGDRSVQSDFVGNQSVISVFVEELFIQFFFAFLDVDRLAVFTRQTKSFLLPLNVFIVGVVFLQQETVISAPIRVDWLDVNVVLCNGQWIVVLLDEFVREDDAAEQKHEDKAKEPDEATKTPPASYHLEAIKNCQTLNDKIQILLCLLT
jgi:hypothetical protein